MSHPVKTSRQTTTEPPPACATPSSPRKQLPNEILLEIASAYMNAALENLKQDLWDSISSEDDLLAWFMDVVSAKSSSATQNFTCSVRTLASTSRMYYHQAQSELDRQRIMVQDCAGGAGKRLYDELEAPILGIPHSRAAIDNQKLRQRSVISEFCLLKAMNRAISEKYFRLSKPVE